MLTCIFASCSDGGSEDPINPTPKPDDVKYDITIDSNIITNGLSFNAKAGENTISFTTNANWTLTVASTTSGSTWCKASATSGAKGSATVKFTVEENTSYEDRSVSVTIKAGTANKTFTITQKSADALLVTTNKFEVAQEGGNIEVELKTNIDYQMEISETAKGWISEASSRALKTYKHTLTIAPNEEAEKREGEITFKSGDKMETVKVYQAGGAILLLTKDEYTVSDAGEMITIEIKSNIEFGVQMPDVDWIDNEASSRGMSSHTLNYYIEPNESYDSRSAEIIFFDKNSNLQDTLKVIQVQKDAIVISQKEYNVKAEGETIEVKLSANVDFEITMPEVDWIEQVSSRAFKEHTLYFKVAENEGEESRSADITFINPKSNSQETLKVTQKQKDSIPSSKLNIILSEKNITKSWIGTSISVKINTNINFDIEIPKIYNWIILTEIYYGTGTARFSIDYNNKSNTNREGFVVFRSKDNGIPNDTLRIIQKASGGFLQGYLEGIYGKYYTLVDSVKIDIPINVEDIIFLREKMEKLIFLDISKATIIDSQYRVPNSQITYKISDNVVDYFYSCPTIKKVILPNNAISINNNAFENCENLDEVVIGSGISTIEHEAFINCKSLRNINLPDNVLSLGERVFEGCNLKNVTIGNKIKTIGDYAFYYSGLNEIDIPDNITNIGKKAFSRCYPLKVNLSKNLKTIDANAFDGCSIEELVLPNNLESIGNEAFRDNSFDKIIIPDNVISVGEKAFYGCQRLKTVILGGSIKILENDVFSECAIDSIIIPNNITTIKRKAFESCNLTKVFLGNNIETIEEHAFSNNVLLKEMTINTKTPPKINLQSFNKSILYRPPTLYVPKGSLDAYKASDWQKYFGEIIEID